MFHFFKSIDDFLTACEEYIEQRVWNGKFIYDLKFISATNIDNAKDSYHKHKEKIKASPNYKAFVAFVKHYWGLLMQRPMVADTVLIFTDWVHLCIKYIAHYIVILIAALISASFLLSTFLQAPVTFSILFVPVLLANHLFISGFFILIEKRERGSHITISEALNQLKQSLSANCFLFFLQISISVSLGTFLLGFSSFLSFLFEEINIDWSSSFFYWMPVVMLGLFLIILLYLITLIIAFSYTFIIIDKKKTRQAINQSWHYLQNDPKHSANLYILLTIASFLYIVFTTANNYEGGFAVSVLFSSQAFLFLGFLLRRNFFSKEITPSLNIFTRSRIPLKPLIGIGLLSYVAFATFTIQTHPEIMKILDERRQTTTVKYDLKTYTNTDSGYSIAHPKTWSVYRWSNHSITLYTNDTGTDDGGVKVDIDVRPEKGSKYFELYEANPGLLIYDTATKNVTTKIANTSIQGENAVKYTYTKVEGNLTEFQTHYLIHHKNQLYDVAFITSSKKTEEDNRDLFDQMIKSFQFSGQKPQ